MIKKLTNKRAAEYAVLLGLLCAIFMSMAHFDAACTDLRQNVLRLHIIANSDSKEDQALKIAVRDRILAQTPEIFDGKTDLEDAEAAVAKALPFFAQISRETVLNNGMSYGASASLGDSYYETREYDDFTLPAGNYRSLIIRLGKAEGKNWWCVVFPAVCIPAASTAELSDSTSKESAAIAENSDRFIMRFRAVEIYEDLKKLIYK